MAGERWRALLAASLLAASAATAVAAGPAGRFLEREVGLPLLFLLRGEVEPPPGVVVVAQDVASGAALGQPAGRLGGWPRARLARVVERAAAAGALAVAVDLRLDVAREGDGELARAIAAAGGRVVLFEWVDPDDPARVLPPHPGLAAAAAATAASPLPDEGSLVAGFWAFVGPGGDRPTLPAAALLAAALAEPGVPAALAAAARARAMPEVEGPLAAAGLPFDRRVGTLRWALRGRPGAAARLAGGLPAGGLGDDAVRLAAAALRLLAGEDSYVLAPYGPAGRVPRVSYRHVLEGEPAALRALAGRIVFVGASEAGRRTDADVFPTALSGGVEHAGVEIAATACLNLLHGHAARAATLPAVVLQAGGAAAVAVGAAALLPPVAALAATLAAGGVVMGASHLALAGHRVVLPVASALLVSLPLGLVAGLALRSGAAQRRLNRAVGLLTRGRVTRADPLGPIAGGVRVPRARWGVALATDVTGYVALTEAWRAREGGFAALVADYRAVVHEVVERHGGTVLDFAGDASMSLWDAAAPDPVARARAVAAALELVEALDRFGAERGLAGHATRAGLAEGRLMLGNIASGEDRFAFGAVGEVLNVAARLEQLNKQLGTRVLATAALVAGLDGLRVTPVGSVLLRGRSQAEELVAVGPHRSG